MLRRTILWGMEDAADSFVAECFWPDVTEADLVALDRRIAKAAAELPPDNGLRYLGSILLREDEVVLCQFEGRQETVSDVVDRAGSRSSVSSPPATRPGRLPGWSQQRSDSRRPELTRNARTRGAFVVIAVAAALGLASAVRAAPAANEICPSFTLNGHKIQWEVIGTWTCKTAKPWVVRLDADHGTTTGRPSAAPQRPNAVSLLRNPRSCERPRHRQPCCYLGTLAFPKSGFTW